jgi:hypothetical protein
VAAVAAAVEAPAAAPAPAPAPPQESGAQLARRVRTGWLYKAHARSIGYGNYWQKRWFTLRGSTISYAKQERGEVGPRTDSLSINSPRAQIHPSSRSVD